MLGEDWICGQDMPTNENLEFGVSVQVLQNVLDDQFGNKLSAGNLSDTNKHSVLVSWKNVLS